MTYYTQYMKSLVFLEILAFMLSNKKMHTSRNPFPLSKRDYSPIDVNELPPCNLLFYGFCLLSGCVGHSTASIRTSLCSPFLSTYLLMWCVVIFLYFPCFVLLKYTYWAVLNLTQEVPAIQCMTLLHDRCIGISDIFKPWWYDFHRNDTKLIKNQKL